ncbi:hypothetical protein Cus16_3010 [Curtobacterium sp. ER1/6]|nr:hypothetical protein Cus16_3010 [Curtobacterium sp. ER1/6]
MVVDEGRDRATVGDRADAVLLAVAVGHRECADLPQVVVVPRAAESDDGRSGVVGELALDVPDPARRRRDDHGVLRPKAESADDRRGGGAGEVEAAGDLPPDVLGLLHDRAARDADPGRVRAALGCVAHDLVADLEVAHLLASGTDDAGEVDALVGRERQVDVVAELPLAEEPFDVVETGGDDLDDHVAGAGFGTFLRDEVDDVEPAVPVVLHCTTDAHGWLLPWAWLRCTRDPGAVSVSQGYLAGALRAGLLRRTLPGDRRRQCGRRARAGSGRRRGRRRRGAATRRGRAVRRSARRRSVRSRSSRGGGRARRGGVRCRDGAASDRAVGELRAPVVLQRGVEQVRGVLLDHQAVAVVRVVGRRVLHEQHVRRVGVPQRRREGHEGVRPVQPLGERHARRRRRREPEQRDRVGEGVLVGELAEHRREEHLLVADPREVAAVVDTVAGAEERERLVALERDLTGGQVQERAVRDRLREADRHPAESVAHRDHAVEGDEPRVRDRQTGEVLHGADHAGDAAVRPALGERGVEHRLRLRRAHRAGVGVRARRDRDHRVPRERHRRHLRVVLADVDEHRDVVAGALGVLRFGVLADTRVRTDEQDVRAALDRVDVLARRPGLVAGTELDRGDVAPEVVRGDGRDAADADQGDDRGGADDAEERRDRSAAPQLPVAYSAARATLRSPCARGHRVPLSWSLRRYRRAPRASAPNPGCGQTWWRAVTGEAPRTTPAGSGGPIRGHRPSRRLRRPPAGRRRAPPSPAVSRRSCASRSRESVRR